MAKSLDIVCYPISIKQLLGRRTAYDDYAANEELLRVFRQEGQSIRQAVDEGLDIGDYKNAEAYDPGDPDYYFTQLGYHKAKTDILQRAYELNIVIGEPKSIIAREEYQRNYFFCWENENLLEGLFVEKANAQNLQRFAQFVYEYADNPLGLANPTTILTQGIAGLIEEDLRGDWPKKLAKKYDYHGLTNPATFKAYLQHQNMGTSDQLDIPNERLPEVIPRLNNWYRNYPGAIMGEGDALL